LKKTRLIGVLCTLVAGVALSAGSASAQTFNIVATPRAGTAALGNWNITVTHVGGENWNVTAIADGVSVPNHDADQITINLHSGFSVFDPNVQVLTNGPGGVVGVPAGAWTSGMGSPRPNADWLDLTTLVELQRTGANMFQGTFVTVAGGAAQVKLVTADLNNVSAQWFGTDVIPEPVSMALMLPGMLPLGLAWLRRRRNSAAEAEDEVTD
jgi:hypothetical protein